MEQIDSSNSGELHRKTVGDGTNQQSNVHLFGNMGIKMADDFRTTKGRYENDKLKLKMCK